MIWAEYGEYKVIDAWNWDWKIVKVDTQPLSPALVTPAASEVVNIQQQKDLLLSQLKSAWYSPKSSWENIYELDFYGLWDKTSLNIHWNNVYLTTYWYDNWKQFSFDLKKTKIDDIMKVIADINKVLELEKKKRDLELINDPYNPVLNNTDKIIDLTTQISVLRTKIS